VSQALHVVPLCAAQLEMPIAVHDAALDAECWPAGQSEHASEWIAKMETSLIALPAV
jgi:hypothetical protein